MACSACAKRRKKLLALKAEKKAKRQGIQAAAIGAVLSVTEAVGNAIGLSGEESESDEAAFGPTGEKSETSS